MSDYTPYQSRYLAEQITLKRPQSSVDGLISAASGVKVDLNPHQVDAAIFAMRSPLSTGALLADEVGLGKTIEAGLVLAQCWAERKRHILLIVPASLRMQWKAELSEKFFIDSFIMESDAYNKLRKEGKVNPFDMHDNVVICSYNFASRKSTDLKLVDWDLVIMDEAHRLRNVYKPNNVMGNKLKTALQGKKKLLLTATPLQNNLMELYGLVSIIDEHVFGDAKSFKAKFASATNIEIRNQYLRERLQPVCIRTLRRQVTEYVPYTERHAILEEYEPTPDEERLYTEISDYLRTYKLYALPDGQRTLVTMVIRKLLASSSFAISGTLESLISRLNDLLQGIESELNLDDYDGFDELVDEDGSNDETNDVMTKNLEQERQGILNEIHRLQGYLDLAKSIKTNSKGDNLLTALEKGFNRTEELGGQRKAVIFTESRRTQEYLFNLLSNNGYKDKIVFLNGLNNDETSKRIYAEWKERHKDDGTVTPSKTANMKAAVVEEFKNNASILIGTEAAAEGINLQFCSLLVNYDLPWNPQRVEQRIGRCHRYGQKNDVVVVNFLNTSNAADKRVYELLNEKFKLFDGVFGSSDEVLGTLESGVDFEKRIASIYQSCRTTDEIESEFDRLQEELSEQIEEKMATARQSILENFDEDVAAKLKTCQADTIASLDKYTRWLYYFALAQGGNNVYSISPGRLVYSENGIETRYNLSWKTAEEQGDVFLRKDSPLYDRWLGEVDEAELSPASLKFDHTNSERHISFFSSHPGLKGMLSVDKLCYSGLTEEEHLIFTVRTDDEIEMDDDVINSMFELPATIVGECPAENASLVESRAKRIQAQQEQVEEANKQYYLEECDKLDAYSEDLKYELQQTMKDLNKQISEKKKICRASVNLPLSEIVEMKDEIDRLEKKRKQMQREIYAKEDEIDTMRDRLQDEIRQKLNGETKIEHIMTIAFEIV